MEIINPNVNKIIVLRRVAKHLFNTKKKIQLSDVDHNSELVDFFLKFLQNEPCSKVNNQKKLFSAVNFCNDFNFLEAENLVKQVKKSWDDSFKLFYYFQNQNTLMSVKRCNKNLVKNANDNEKYVIVEFGQIIPYNTDVTGTKGKLFTSFPTAKIISKLSKLLSSKVVDLILYLRDYQFEFSMLSTGSKNKKESREPVTPTMIFDLLLPLIEITTVKEFSKSKVINILDQNVLWSASDPWRNSEWLSIFKIIYQDFLITDHPGDSQANIQYSSHLFDIELKLYVLKQCSLEKFTIDEIQQNLLKEIENEFKKKSELELKWKEIIEEDVEDNRTLNFSKMKVSENLNHSITKKLHDFIKYESSKDDEISISTPVINEDEIGDTIVKLEKKIMELQTVFQVIGIEY
jgi:hypothetical protein